MTSETEGRRQQTRILAGALSIVALIFLVYSPILPGTFVMDDARLISGNNPLMNGSLNLHTLWFGTDFTLANFGWWLEHLAFGDHPLGYHLVDLLLQATSCILLWRVLVQLKIPGAWLAAALFAVHPVCVNSVARIAELKNTLSLPFFLLSLLAYLRYEATTLYPAKQDANRNPSSRWRGTAWLTLSLVAFILALLAKTIAVTLPAVLLMCGVWQRRRLAFKDILHTVPFFVLAFAFGLMSVWFQKHQALTSTDQLLAPESFGQRLAGAGGNIWFYLGKAIIPVQLSVAYYRPPVDAGGWTAYLPLMAIAVLVLLCWRYHRSWGWHLLFGLGCFGVMLFPALGFFDAQYQTMWSVSDHLQYNALIAIMGLLAAALAILFRRTGFPAIGLLLLLAFSVLSFQRARVFASENGLVRDTLKKNPMSWAAHNDLGTILAGKGDYAGAAQEFALSLQYNPHNLEAAMNLGHALSLEGKPDEADQQFLAALKMDFADAAMHKAYAEALIKQGRGGEALHQLQLAAILQPNSQTDLELASWLYSSGNPGQSVIWLRHAVALDPNNAQALNNLAWILATSADDSLRNGKESVKDAQKACRLTSFKSPEMLSALAAAYAETGDFTNAVTTIHTALKLATAAGSSQLVAADEQCLRLYNAGQPFHQP